MQLIKPPIDCEGGLVYEKKNYSNAWDSDADRGLCFCHFCAVASREELSMEQYGDLDTVRMLCTLYIVLSACANETIKKTDIL